MPRASLLHHGPYARFHTWPRHRSSPRFPTERRLVRVLTLSPALTLLYEVCDFCRAPHGFVMFLISIREYRAVLTAPG